MPEETTEQELKDMNLHDEMVLDYGILVKRVIGGWIYWKAAQHQSEIDKVSTSVSCTLAGVFVPEP